VHPKEIATNHGVHSLVFLRGRYTGYNFTYRLAVEEIPNKTVFCKAKNNSIQDKTGMFSAKYS